MPLSLILAIIGILLICLTYGILHSLGVALILIAIVLFLYALFTGKYGGMDQWR